MATEQLPSATYTIAGQQTVTGWEVLSSNFGFQEDGEDKADAAGQHKARINYSRRQTLQLEMEALAAADIDAYQTGGQVASGIFTLADGSTAAAWNIVSATMGQTRGVTTCSLSLIQQADAL